MGMALLQDLYLPSCQIMLDFSPVRISKLALLYKIANVSEVGRGRIRQRETVSTSLHVRNDILMGKCMLCNDLPLRKLRGFNGQEMMLQPRMGGRHAGLSESWEEARNKIS